MMYNRRATMIATLEAVHTSPYPVYHISILSCACMKEFEARMGNIHDKSQKIED